MNFYFVSCFPYVGMGMLWISKYYLYKVWSILEIVNFYYNLLRIQYLLKIS